ncbi:hypothetical protein [Aporhodopirellula aestuarii]|uniref:Uncharacterized protein n=1 Tax=Aporhodopirellula aestuarii TaxID=2950107 RepID=A0ABT0U6G7_9BACT|nr:hypothetical protein [Aporhodopirellula aestuarii]MCM2372515.1 hypothetical protein [Aporhodopirellula aestuarii]
MNTSAPTRNQNSRRLTAPATFSCSLLLLASVTLVTLTTPPTAARGADQHVISFDLPPTAVAVPVASQRPDDLIVRSGGEPVEVTLRLSSLVSGSAFPQIDRWMIRCVPRQTSWQVMNYSPRTETASEYSGTIQVKTCDEESESFGASVDLTQGSLATANVEGGKGSKQTESLQYERHAPLHAVTASGTIERGRGVYYKLRWTSTQVLEGEKEFKITFDVPAGFRAGLLDVSVVAIGRPAKKSSVSDAFSQIPVIGEDRDSMRPLGEGRFVVAVHAEGDPVAWNAAREFAEAEATLRNEARKVRATSPARSLSTLLRHVAAKLDADSVDLHSDWAERLIFNKADPYVDPIIRKLPADVRVVALEYCDARRSLETLKTRVVDPQSTEIQLTDLVKSSIGVQ